MQTCPLGRLFRRTTPLSVYIPIHKKKTCDSSHQVAHPSCHAQQQSPCAHATLPTPKQQRRACARAQERRQHRQVKHPNKAGCCPTVLANSTHHTTESSPDIARNVCSPTNPSHNLGYQPQPVRPTVLWLVQLLQQKMHALHECAAGWSCRMQHSAKHCNCIIQRQQGAGWGWRAPT